ncbi:MAG: prolyl oligopeptidase family serine peptidase [Polyangiaceae bacterium]|nr:prolyl oligopeptidase family serine peptidase [Polyangiaceae bacterium]
MRAGEIIGGLAVVVVTGCSGAHGPAPTPPPAGPGTLEERSFSSSALGVEKQYLVHLPEGYHDSGKRYPVVYLLHHLTSSERTWMDDMEVDATASDLALQAILVMPDGDDSYFTNSVTPADYEQCLAGPLPFERREPPAQYCVRQANYEDYLISDLVAEVDARYRTVARADARALTGVSMGGFAAFSIVLRHPDVFRSAASHSGVLSLRYAGPYPFDARALTLFDAPAGRIAALGPLGGWWQVLFGDRLAHWNAIDPAELAKTVGLEGLSLYLDAGWADEYGLHAEAAHLHYLLQERGAPHTFELVDGGRHDVASWAQRLGESLSHHVQHFRRSGVYPE